MRALYRETVINKKRNTKTVVKLQNDIVVYIYIYIYIYKLCVQKHEWKDAYCNEQVGEALKQLYSIKKLTVIQ